MAMHMTIEYFQCFLFLKTCIFSVGAVDLVSLVITHSWFASRGHVEHFEYEAHAAIAGLKYTVKVSRRGPQSFRVFLGTSHVDVVARKLNDGGLLVQVCSLTLLSRAHPN